MSIIALTDFALAAPPAAVTDNTTGIFDKSSVSADRLRNGDIGFDDIPNMINSATSFFLGLAASVAMIVIIYGALKMSFASFENAKEQGKKAVTYGITGFIIAISAWLIVQMAISNL